MELMIPIDSHGETPLYEQIYRFIKGEIQQGRLAAESRLPSTRTLAENLKVSRSTTQMAYDQLVSEGYLKAVPCRGYFVCRMEELFEVKVAKENPAERAEMTREKVYEVDFSPRGIDLNRFPFSAWRKINKEILNDDNKELFRTGDPQGEWELREIIRSYLYSARGVVCREEQIIVGAGSEYLLMLLCQVLGNGNRIAMEDPTYKQAYHVFSSQGFDVEPVRMDASGMDVEELRAAAVNLAYVMPSHQYPTGIVMPITRRQELLKWANESGERYLIEDDYDSEFRYKGKPVPALQGLDKNGKVIYVGTFSKSIAPAIRVSYLVLPDGLVREYRSRLGFYSSTVSRIDQKILYEFIARGYFERHLNRMRAIYKSKHDLLLAELKQLEGDFTISGEYAGLHLLLTDRRGIPEERLIGVAAEAGIRVYGLSRCFIQAGDKELSTVVLGYANVREEQIEAGIRELCECWRDL